MQDLSDSSTQSPDIFVRFVQQDRQAWLSVLAKAAPADVLSLWEQVSAPEAVILRPSEVGMVMVRGRAGGSGDAFNLGEMTVTRCVIRLETGETGIGYVAGRDKRHAHAAAMLDAMMQSAVLRAEAERLVVAPLRVAARNRADAVSRKAKATQVEFFTMVRDRKA
jgi:alpha-D-ribose 1-methylphosphonate 5-triphosphate synthase subunit PhnG